MDHADMGMSPHVHNHSDHAPHAEHAAHDDSMAGMSHDHGAVGRRADGTYYYTHGAYLGHMVPGTFFIIWGTFWLLATFHNYIISKTGNSNNRPNSFKTRPWHKLWFGPAKLRELPLEPIVKIVLPFFGILGELWLGHGPAYMALHSYDGKFNVGNLNDWQHACMYSAFVTSGVVDLLAHKVSIPANVEHAFLGLAFLSEGILLGFHLKGPDIEWLLHFILVLQIFATFFAVMMEILFPRSVVVATLRPMITIVQGIWWIQTAYFMYTSMPEWDPDYMGSGMFIPVILVMDLLLMSFGCLIGLLAMQWVYGKVYGNSYVAFSPLKNNFENGGSGGGGGNGNGRFSFDDEERALEMASMVDDGRKSSYTPVFTLK